MSLRHAGGTTVSAAFDVTRIEHENLFGQVQKHLLLIEHLETEIRRLQARLNEIEKRVSLDRRSVT